MIIHFRVQYYVENGRLIRYEDREKFWTIIFLQYSSSNISDKVLVFIVCLHLLEYKRAGIKKKFFLRTHVSSVPKTEVQ